MFQKQLSIFAQNTPNRLAEICELLAENEINIRAISTADTESYGILRLIVEEPEKAEEALKKAGLAVSVTQVLSLPIADKPGALAKLLRVISDANIDIEYAYAFLSHEDNLAFAVLRVEDEEKAMQTLKSKGFA